MRIVRTRNVDSTFDLNLAPVLDIIVSIVPMLLLSVAFLQVRMIETPVPQVVAEKIAEQKQQKQISISLKVNKSSGFIFTIVDGGKKNDVNVALKAGQYDYDALLETALKIKRQYTDIFKLDLEPSVNVSYDEIIKTMDAVRRIPNTASKLTFLDSKTGQNVQTDLMFPDVVFSNVIGD